MGAPAPQYRTVVADRSQEKQHPEGEEATMQRMRLRWSVAAAAVSTLMATAGAMGQEWPTKPIRFIVPFTPGGVTDTISRVLQEPLSQALKQPVVVENKPGAGGTTGTEVIVRSEPDGHTVGLVISTLAANAAIQKKLSFDPVNDISPITRFGVNNLPLVVHPTLPVKTVVELVDYAKKNPDKISYASSGVGSAQHFAGEILKNLAGIDMLHVPYRGGAPAVADLLAGRVQLMFPSPAIRPHIESGKLIALAVSHSERSKLFPSLPTLSEAGVKGYGIVEWYAIIGPARIPPAIVDRINREIVRIVQDATLQERMLQQGVEMVTSTPDELRNWIADEVARLKDIASRMKIEVE
jgi:tripartite-type tricarboxylate transporter receptor subunit TctC